MGYRLANKRLAYGVCIVYVRTTCELITGTSALVTRNLSRAV